MKIIKRLFCNHKYKKKDGYALLGWEKCMKCGKERYNDKLEIALE